MVPEFRSKLKKEFEAQNKTARRAAVMALFYPDEKQQTSLLLILRKTYEGVHSNQIGFPGGKEEKADADLLETALRETHEEVGVLPKHVEVIKPLSEVYIAPSNFIVSPFIGLYKNKNQFIIQEDEVEAVVEVLLTNFMDDTNLVSTQINTSYAKKVQVPAFNFDGHIVWGATAMMLSEIKTLLKQVL